MSDLQVYQMTGARIPTSDGEFRLYLYRNNQDDKENLALVMGDVADKERVLVRVHSECFTGDVLGSLRCDCGAQLSRAMEMITAAGEGVLIYLRQEGRGIGLLDKLRAYNLQDAGFDTVDANLILGHQPDERDYGMAASILTDLGVHSIRLLTNNPEKLNSLKGLGIAVSDRIPLQTPVTPENAGYLKTKIVRMHHMLNLNRVADLQTSTTSGA
jgi:GTP cyclohydrolase II